MAVFVKRSYPISGPSKIYKKFVNPAFIGENTAGVHFIFKPAEGASLLGFNDKEKALKRRGFTFNSF